MEVTGYVHASTALSPARFGSGGEGKGIPTSAENPNRYFQPVVSFLKHN
jgi:hypothetical protein